MHLVLGIIRYLKVDNSVTSRTFIFDPKDGFEFRPCINSVICMCELTRRYLDEEKPRGNQVSILVNGEGLLTCHV